jgi:hypothetical protein
MYPEWKKGRRTFKVLTGTPAGKRPEGLGVDGGIIFELILRKLVSIRGIGLIRLKIDIIGGKM